MRTSALFGANTGFFEIYCVSTQTRGRGWASEREFVWTYFIDCPLLLL